MDRAGPLSTQDRAGHRGTRKEGVYMPGGAGRISPPDSHPSRPGCSFHGQKIGCGEPQNPALCVFRVVAHGTRRGIWGMTMGPPRPTKNHLPEGDGGLVGDWRESKQNFAVPIQPSGRNAARQRRTRRYRPPSGRANGSARRANSTVRCAGSTAGTPCEPLIRAASSGDALGGRVEMKLHRVVARLAMDIDRAGEAGARSSESHQ